VQQGTGRVDDAGVLAGERLQRDERGAAAGRALVLEAAPEQLQLLAEAELPDRAVGDGALAVVGAAGGPLDLVLPLRPEQREVALGPPLRERRGLDRRCRQLRQR
jgi:hypothetical protein